MGLLKNVLSAVAQLTSAQGRSYLVTLDKNGTERRTPLDKYYTPENPPPQNASIEYAARLTP